MDAEVGGNMEPVTRFGMNTEGFDAAISAVEEGKVIVLPTDTVYGIAANPFDEDAIGGLLAAKKRDTTMPPPVLIAEPSMLRALTGAVPAGARALSKKFWPGALTLILKEQKSVGLHLGETAGTVAIRVPDHDATRELLRRTGPLGVSSANITGSDPATTVEEAEAQLGESVSVYLDGGSIPGPTPSTIVDFASDEDGIVLRLGALTLEQLREVVPTIKTVEQDEAEPAEEAPDEEAPDEGEGEGSLDAPHDA